MNIPSRSIHGQAIAIACALACAVAAAGCKSGGDQAQAAPAVPGPVVTQASWAPDALEELVAPIALYPDPLLGQILAASVNPQEVLDGGNWLVQNQNLKGDELTAAAQKAGLGPAMQALIQFPTVVDMMCQQLDWTRQLGSAFTSDQKAVLDAVQRLRTHALNVGNLKTTPQQTVETTKQEGKTVVEVKPAEPHVIYVPQYDPTVVYTTPPPPSPSSGDVLLAFGVGIAVGAAISNSYCYPHWGAGVVFVGPRPFYPPAYVYRPVYGPGFHPAYRYAPPPGYRYSYNHSTNVVIHNNNYYDRFNNNSNLHGGATRSPIAAKAQGRNSNLSGQTSWKGQGAYAGAKAGSAARPGQSGAAVSHGSATSERTAAAARPASAAQPAERSPGAAGGGAPNQDRGYGGSARGGPADAVSAPHGAPEPSAPARDDVFSGATQSGNGAFDRASSARGHASAAGTTGHAGFARRR